jgi:hypothetical protein
VRLLIADLVRRNAVVTAVFALMLLGLLWVGHWGEDPARAFGFSMGLAFALGPVRLLWLVPLPIWYLPVARRDVWRGAWLLSTAGTTTLTTAIKLFALAAFTRVEGYGVGNVLLSSVYDLAYAGAGCALVVVATYPGSRHAIWRQMWPVLAGLANFLLPLGMASAFVVLYTDVVPTRWAALTPVGLLVLATTLVVGLATWFYTPRPPGWMPDTFMFTTARTSGRRRPARRLSAGGRSPLSGLPRLLAHEYAWTLIVLAAMVTGTTMAISIAVGLQYHESPRELFRTAVLLLGDASTPSQGVARLLTALLWFVFVVATLAARFPSMLRHLRVLPLRLRYVNLLLVAWPAVIWATIWLALLMVQTLATGHVPASLHLALFIGAAGLSAIVQSITLRLAGPTRVLAFSAAIALVPILQVVGGPDPRAIAWLGIAGLVGAAILNRAALRHSSTYRTASAPATPRRDAAS